MIDVIEDLEKKGIRVVITPSFDRSIWYWKAGVYIGNDNRAHWVDTDNNLPWACYSGYREAFEAVVNYCNDNKKGKKKQ